MQMSANLPDTPIILEAVLEGFVRAAQAEVMAGIVPPYPDDAGVKYVEESAGSERWKLPHETHEDGQGDCEDLTFWEAGGMRATGEDPGARVMLVKTGPRKLHAVVLRSDGSISDPSARLKAREKLARRSGAAVSGGDIGCIGDLDEEGFDVEVGAVRVIARNGVTPEGKPYRPPVRDPKKSRPAPVIVPTGARREGRPETVSPLTQQKLQAKFDAQSPYYPPGYLPPGMYPYEGYPPFPGQYMMESPMAYGSPYSGEAMYGFASDYWGTGGDSPYGWVWGNGPMVTYEDLYGEFDIRPNPFGVEYEDEGYEDLEEGDDL